MIDNLPAHKAAGVREAIEARGAMLRYLPQIFAGPEPDRDACQQAQGLSAQGRRTNNSAPAPPDRRFARPSHATLVPCQTRHRETSPVTTHGKSTLNADLCRGHFRRIQFVVPRPEIET